MTRHILPIILLCFLVAFAATFMDVYKHAPKQTLPEFRYDVQLINSMPPQVTYELTKSKSF